MLGPGLGFLLRFREHRVEVPRDGLPVLLQHRIERVPVREIAHPCQAQSILGVLRQIVALGVVELLQAMLDVPEKHVGGAQLFHRLRRKEVAAAEELEHLQRRSRGELRLAAAARELQRLDHELDLADAARTELHVVGELAPRTRGAPRRAAGAWRPSVA